MPTRYHWLDLARGLAVLSMLVAHTAPVGGVFNVTEYVTAPLFAATIGISAVYAWRKWDAGAPRFLASYAVRGVLLFLAGVAAQPIYAQIVVVLQWLGALTVLLAPLVILLHRRPAIAAAAAALLVAVAPTVMTEARLWLALHPGHWSEPVLTMVATHPNYRLVTVLAAGLVGVALAGWLAATTKGRALIVTVLAGAVAGAALVLGKTTTLGADPYSGTWPEIVVSLALVVAALAGSRWLGEMVPTTWLRPVVDTGRMAMTAYVLQLVVLRLITDMFLDGGRDDHWWVLIATAVIVVGVCVLWRRFVGQGPLEWLLRAPSNLITEHEAARRRRPEPAV